MIQTYVHRFLPHGRLLFDRIRNLNSSTPTALQEDDSEISSGVLAATERLSYRLEVFQRFLKVSDISSNQTLTIGKILTDIFDPLMDRWPGLQISPSP